VRSLTPRWCAGCSLQTTASRCPRCQGFVRYESDEDRKEARRETQRRYKRSAKGKRSSHRQNRSSKGLARAARGRRKRGIPERPAEWGQWAPRHGERRVRCRNRECSRRIPERRTEFCSPECEARAKVIGWTRSRRRRPDCQYCRTNPISTPRRRFCSQICANRHAAAARRARGPHRFFTARQEHSIRDLADAAVQLNIGPVDVLRFVDYGRDCGLRTVEWGHPVGQGFAVRGTRSADRGSQPVRRQRQTAGLEWPTYHALVMELDAQIRAIRKCAKRARAA